MPRPAVFLDRDGTLIEDVHYLQHPDQVKVLPGAIEGVRLWNDAGVPVIVVTNQSGVARGYFPECEIAPVHAHLSALFAQFGARIDAYYHCPHHPDGVIEAYRIDCECRKPKPGMLSRAAQDLNLDLSRSWMIGNQLSDVRAGAAAGCRTILLGSTPHTLSEVEQSDLRLAGAVDDFISCWNLWKCAESKDGN